MNIRKTAIGVFSVSALALTALNTSVVEAEAENKLLKGIAIGGGAAIVINEILKGGKKKEQPASRNRTPRKAVAKRKGDETLKRVQINLNAMGCDAGVPDGFSGKNTRSAIRCFQERADLPVTGKLTDQERAFVLAYVPKEIVLDKKESQEPQEKHASDQSDSKASPEIPPKNEPNQSQDDTSKPELTDVNASTPLKGSIFDRLDNGDGANIAPEVPSVEFPKPTKTTAVCTFLNAQDTNAHAQNAKTMERFCAVRAHLISDLEQILSAQPALDKDQFWAQCEQLVAFTQSYVGRSAKESPAKYVEELKRNFATSNDNQAIINGYSFCVAEALSKDRFDVSLASSFATFASGGGEFGELIASHLALGLGVEKSKEFAAAWYMDTAASIENGDYVALVDLPSDRATPLLRNIALGLLPKQSNPANSPPLIEIRLPGAVSDSAKAAADRRFSMESAIAIKQASGITEMIGVSLKDKVSFCASEAAVGFSSDDLKYRDLLTLKLCRMAAYADHDVALALKYETQLAAFGDPHSSEMVPVLELLVQ